MNVKKVFCSCCHLVVGIVVVSLLGGYTKDGCDDVFNIRSMPGQTTKGVRCSATQVVRCGEGAGFRGQPVYIVGQVEQIKLYMWPRINHEWSCRLFHSRE